jgi:hypothetical protein
MVLKLNLEEYMNKKDCEDMEECQKWFEKHWMKHGKAGCYHHHDSASGAVYGLGLIGALIFFIGNATTFWGGVLGILQAIVWPAYLVYEVLNYFIK